MCCEHTGGFLFPAGLMERRQEEQAIRLSFPLASLGLLQDTTGLLGGKKEMAGSG